MDSKVYTQHDDNFSKSRESPARTFSSFIEATRAGYRTKDSWTLDDRKVIGLATAGVVFGVDLGPVWHVTQTRPCDFRPRTKAYIHFRRLFGFESKTYLSAYDGGWSHQYEWFSSSRIAQHLNGSKVCGGFAGLEQKAVILDVDFHEPVSDIVPCLNALQVVLDECPALMERLNGFGLHFQSKETDLDGLHLIFFLIKPLPADPRPSAKIGFRRSSPNMLTCWTPEKQSPWPTTRQK